MSPKERFCRARSNSSLHGAFILSNELAPPSRYAANRAPVRPSFGDFEPFGYNPRVAKRRPAGSPILVRRLAFGARLAPASDEWRNPQVDPILNVERLIVYGRHSCGRSHWLYEELMEHQVDFEWRDIVMGEPRFREELLKLARGCLSVPTVIFPDGAVMVEPRPDQVLNKLQLGDAARA